MKSVITLENGNTVSGIYEQYEFKGWLITIQNYYGPEALIGFATPTKYAHILNLDNYYLIDEIAKENKIQEFIDDEGYSYYKDFDYIVADPDDIEVNFLAGINTSNASCVLSYMVKQILMKINPPHNDEHFLEWNRFNDTKIIILKQIHKKSIIPKSSKKSRGFNQVAWASMVKLRDGKCKECGSVYDLHAHHIKPFKSHTELRYDVNNGITLCGVCHRRWHSENGK